MGEDPLHVVPPHDHNLAVEPRGEAVAVNEHGMPHSALEYLEAIRPHASRDLWQMFPDRDGIGGNGEQMLIPRGRAGRYLQIRNELGYGVFVALSDFDEPRRLIENVVRVHHVWVDKDDGPLPDSWRLEPHAVVNTSEDKYQGIWRVDGVPQDRDTHNRLIRALADVFGGDAGAQGLNRVLRVPGFHHCKRERRLVRLVNARHDRAWTFAEALEAWPELARATEPPARPQATTVTHPDRYTRAALEDEAATVATAPEGRRNVTLTRSAFNLGTLAGSGALDHDLATETLVAAAMRAGLPEREARTTTERQVRAGMRHPRGRGAS